MDESVVYSRKILDVFKDKLQEWERVGDRGRHFYRIPDFEDWMRRTEKRIGQRSSNTELLLRALEPKAKQYGKQFPLQADKVLKGDRTCLLVFGVLLQQDLGYLIDIFRDAYIVDKTLEISSNYHNELRYVLGRKGGSESADTIIEKFEAAKWAFCSPQLRLNMEGIFEACGYILPFCRRETVNEKGGTASVDQVAVQEEQVPKELRKVLEKAWYKDKDFGPCYRMALKIFDEDKRDDFIAEQEALSSLNIENSTDGQSNDDKPFIRYLGQFSLGEKVENKVRKTYNLLLQFGELDLDEYLAGNRPPERYEEIMLFWKNLFKIAKALRVVHAPYVDGGHYDGWHGDVKPDNILVVDGNFKLADFGFAKFKVRSNEIPKAELAGWTKTYGAPEVDAAVSQSEFMQTIDIWSFGTVLLLAATWVVLDNKGLLQFEFLRRLAISALRERKKSDSQISVPTASDAFHDGKAKLAEIKSWCTYIREHIRRCDTITSLVLDLVENKMLQQDPNDRISSKQLCDELTTVERTAEDKRNTMLRDRDIKQIDLNVLRALLAVEKAHNGGVSLLSDESDRNVVVETKLETGLLFVPVGRSIRGSRRVGKSQRLEVPMAQTAHRQETLEKQMANKGMIVPTIPQHNSAEGSRTQYMNVQSFELHPHPQSPVASVSLTVSPPEESPPDSTYSHSITPSETPKSLGVIDRGPQPTPSTNKTNGGGLGLPPSLKAGKAPTNEGYSGQRRPYPPRSRLTPVKEDGHMDTPSSALPMDANGARSPPLTLDNKGKERASTTPHSKSSLSPPIPPSRTLQDLNHDIFITRREMAEKKTTATAKARRLLFGKEEPDSHLVTFIRDRDLVFLVDNSTSMVKFRHLATFIVETLAMKLGGIDKDGLDLKFTLGEGEYDVNGVKGDAPDRFKAAMGKAWEKSGGLHPIPTDMSHTLGQFFSKYLSRPPQKRTTLLIITDGVWDGPTPQGEMGKTKVDKVETTIVEFIGSERLKAIRLLEKRFFTIQFIRVGNNSEAAKRLQRFDDDLEEAYVGKNLPDVIDCVHWTGSVEKMILGSMRAGIDGLGEASDEPPPNINELCAQFYDQQPKKSLTFFGSSSKDHTFKKAPSHQRLSSR